MGRIQIFIVDDEIASINYFKSVLGEGERYALAGEALDAKSALAQVARKQPDITFVDVCMPDMDGIALTERLLEINPSGRIVLLTSYKNFDYIKRGYSVGISGYLLKHELTRELLRAEIDKNFTENQRERFQSLLVSQYHVRRFLEGKAGAVPQLLAAEVARRSRVFYLFAAVADSALYAQADELAGDCQSLAQSAFPVGLACEIVFAARRDVWVGLLSAESLPSAQAMRGRLYEAAMLVRRFFRDGAGTVSVLLSGPAREPGELPAHYRGLLLAAGGAFLLGRDQIRFLNETEGLIPRPTGVGAPSPVGCAPLGRLHTPLGAGSFVELRQPSPRPEDYDAALSAFGEALTHLGQQEASELMEQVLQQAAGTADLDNYRNVVRDLLLLANRFCLFYSLEKPGHSGSAPPAFRSVEEVVPWFRATIARCIHSVLEKQSDCYSKRIQGAVVFIQQNFARNIAIDDVAQAVYLSPGHLRHLFKKEVGVTVADYIAEYRIDMAKKYLREGMVRVGDVYAKVGFASSQYFASVFKKVTGLTPTEYSRLSAGDQRVDATCVFI